MRSLFFLLGLLVRGSSVRDGMLHYDCSHSFLLVFLMQLLQVCIADDEIITLTPETFDSVLIQLLQIFAGRLKARCDQIEVQKSAGAHCYL